MKLFTFDFQKKRTPVFAINKKATNFGKGRLLKPTSRKQKHLIEYNTQIFRSLTKAPRKTSKSRFLIMPDKIYDCLVSLVLKRVTVVTKKMTKYNFLLNSHGV